MDSRLDEELGRIDSLLARLRGEREELDRIIRNLERDRVDLVLHWEGGRHRPDGELMADVALEALRAIGRPARAREIYEVMARGLGYQFLAGRSETSLIGSISVTLNTAKGRFMRVDEGLWMPAEPSSKSNGQSRPAPAPEHRGGAAGPYQTKVGVAVEALRAIARPARAREIAAVMAGQFGFRFEGDPPNRFDINRLLSTMSKAPDRFARVNPGSGLWRLTELGDGPEGSRSDGKPRLARQVRGPGSGIS